MLLGQGEKGRFIVRREVGDVVDDFTSRGKAFAAVNGWNKGSKKVNEDTPSALLTRHEV